MTDLQPGDTVIIQADPRCWRLAGLDAVYQGTDEAGHAVIQIGTVGATVPPTCLRLAEQARCACGKPFWRAVGALTTLCAACQAKAEEEEQAEDFDPADLVTDEDIADWHHPEHERGLDWDTGASDVPPRRVPYLHLVKGKDR